MKRLMLICLFGICAAAGAQTGPAKRTDAESAQADAKREADLSKTRAELEEARERLAKAAREVAELSTQLGERERRDILVFRNGDPQVAHRRAMLGVQIDPQSGNDGARVKSVSPGGPAAEAGLVSGDVIVSIDGKSIVGKESSYRALVAKMREVKPDQKVKVRVLRSGKNKDLVVLTRPMAVHTATVRRLRDGRGRDGEEFIAGAFGSPAAGMHLDTLPMVHELRGFFPGEFGGLELASLTPKLGAYFGTSEGVLVVQAPENGAFKLEDGDVIQSIDGRKPEDGAHALRILRSYKPGEKLNVNVLRQRKATSLSITMPERPEFMEHFSMPVPPVPPAPAVAPVPATPGTLE